MFRPSYKLALLTGCMISVFCFFNVSHALVSISDRVDTRIQEGVNTMLPDINVFRLKGSDEENMDYWTQVLDDRDKNAQKYLVVPANGLVMPINTIPENTQDYKDMAGGKLIDVNKYLKTGALQYPVLGKRGFGNIGNSVIFGHSSYWNNDDGRYKTHFGKIIELEVGEEVWIYERTLEGKYNRYRYMIKKSYNTPDTDTSVLYQSDKKEVTLLTCTPIGLLTHRWVIKAEYIEPIISENKIEKGSTSTELRFSDVFFKHKAAVRSAFSKISVRSDGKEFFKTINGRIDTLLEKQNYRKYHSLLRFMKYEVEKRLK